MIDKKIAQKNQQFYFDINKNFECFGQFRLVKNGQTMLKEIKGHEDETKKIQALIKGCIKRNEKSLYKGQKFYLQDLQFILDQYHSVAQTLMKNFNIVLNKTQTKANVQCHNCANFTDIWKFCSICEDVHYCHQGCQMKIKLTHERQQCRIRSFPKLYKPIQVEIHLGSDLGRNIHFCFQHQVSMSLLVRGQKILDQLMTFLNTPQGNVVLDDYHAKIENRMVKFEKEIIRPQVAQKKDQLKFESIEEFINFYTDNKTLRGLEIFLLENGAMMWKKIREVHDNHFREVFIFHYP